jgi:hypothetical protein
MDGSLQCGVCTVLINEVCHVIRGKRTWHVNEADVSAASWLHIYMEFEIVTGSYDGLVQGFSVDALDPRSQVCNPCPAPPPSFLENYFIVA